MVRDIYYIILVVGSASSALANPRDRTSSMSIEDTYNGNRGIL